MSRLLSRILLAMLMLPLAALVHLAVCIAMFSVYRYPYAGRSDHVVFMVSGAVTWGLMAGYWFLLWRSVVRWTSRRIIQTTVAALGAVVAGAVTGAGLAALLGRGNDSFGTFFGSALAPLL
jgi:hypothetical protein